MEHTANGQQTEFFVVLADQADLSPAANLPTKAEKGRFVYQTLLEKAHTTQEPILQWLRERNIEHQSFYIVNAILVKGDRQLAETLAARPDVAHINGNPLIHNDLPQPGLVEKSGGRPATIEPGIVYTHAPDVWGLGFRGETIVVAGADTGIRWTHNVLKPHYRGWDGDKRQSQLSIGMTPFTTVWATLVGTIRSNLATISVMAPIQSARWSATMALATRLEWRPAQSGSVAVTWTRAPARQPGTSSAWSGFLRRIH